MTWSYNPGATDRDTVRLLIGDTDSTSQQLSDEEIDIFLALSSGVYDAAARAALAIAAKFSRLVSQTVGAVSATYSDRARAYHDLAKDLSDQAKTTGSLPQPYVGGIHRGDKAAVLADPDRVRPQFRVGRDDNPKGSNS